MNCKNCGHIIEGTYCTDCGQKSDVGRLTLTSLLHELTESIFQVDRGFFYTLMQLFTRPGNSISEYLIGKRRKHFKPIAYLITFSTIYFIISEMIGQNTWMDDLITGFTAGGSNKVEVSRILTWFAKNYAYTSLLLIPVFSFSSFISFWGAGKNYIEHFVINSYITGQQAILYSIFAILKQFIGGELFDILPVAVAVSYAILVFWQLFDKGSRWKILLKSLLTYVLYLFLSLGLLIVVLGVAEITK